MWMEEPEYDDYEEENRRGPSKSSRKRESAALQDLGQELLELSMEQLQRLALPADLYEAVRLGKTITAHGGLRRQRKFIGKLLRDIDPEPIRARLAAIKHEGADAVRLQHECEHWRERMLEEGDATVNEFVGENPLADRQKLRQLIRDGRREREERRPQKSARLLFRYVREVLGASQDADEALDLGDFGSAAE